MPMENASHAEIKSIGADELVSVLSEELIGVWMGLEVLQHLIYRYQYL